MNLKRLELTLTTKCNSQCIHCQADASPLRNDVMEVKDAYDYLTEATAVSNIESFMIFGGEPMLYSKRAIALIKKAHQLQIPKIEMITNGVWGKNKAIAEKLAKKLKVAGLNSASISVDVFHLQYIPLEYPRNAALALLEAGIEDVSWNVAVIESINATNEFDKKTKQILETLQPIGLDYGEVKIVPVGRATQNLRRYFQPTPLYGSCEGDPVIENTLTNPGVVCIEPSGSVHICWDLIIGNAKNKPLSQIITEYDWRRNQIIRTLVEEGPTGLPRLLRARSHRFEEDQYVNKCHLCMEIRKTLKLYHLNAYS
ncbi:MAG: molybdenum cofactor biosynthesis protein A [Candidatus Bathyarchaeota archaeon BA1]|nr:MAG: molybdenum cofactor biosynthesis protein A [Candidatus Bathyarchaeota archaeon BA1]